MKRYTLCKCCFCVLVLLFFTAWMDCPWEPLSQEAPGSNVIVLGTVGQIEEKEKDGQQRQYIISLHTVTFCNGTSPDKNRKQNMTEKKAKGVLCYMEEGEVLPLYGERVVIEGKAERFQHSRNPGGFDVCAYYRAKGVEFYVTNAKIVKRGETYNGYRQALSVCRQKMSALLSQVGGEDAGILQAMLLGDKNALSPDIRKLYQENGISHILAISGLHISFLGLGLYRVLRKLWLPVPAAGILSGIVLLSYVVMAGGSPSSWRAGMMFVFGLVAEITGRSCHRMTLLSVSALILAVGRPLLLLQSGFLLSYGAILGLELMYPILEQTWSSRGIRPFLAGISICIITLPIILKDYFVFPIYSFFLNLLVIPLMSVVMALGLGAMAGGMFSVSFGRMLFLPVHWILWTFRMCCCLAERLPGSIWITGQPAPVQIVMYYSLLLVFFLLKKYTTGYWVIFWLGSALWILTHTFHPGNTLTMLDVGQGDGIVIRSDKENTILVDCGSSSEKKLAEYTLLPYLKSQGIRKIEYIFLTHMDSDHISGIEELITNQDRRIEIGTLVLPALVSTDEAYEKIVQEAVKAKIRVCTMGAGDRLTIDNLTFWCLHPEREKQYSDRNASSLVLYLDAGAFSALLTGDLDGAAEEAFAENYPRQLEQITVLKVGHHGSGESSKELLLSKCRPEIALISCGEKNRYGHPDTQTLCRLEEKGCRIYVTKDTGAIRLDMGKGEVQIPSFPCSLLFPNALLSSIIGYEKRGK